MIIIIQWINNPSIQRKNPVQIINNDNIDGDQSKEKNKKIDPDWFEMLYFSFFSSLDDNLNDMTIMIFSFPVYVIIIIIINPPTITYIHFMLNQMPYLQDLNNNNNNMDLYQASVFKYQKFAQIYGYLIIIIEIDFLNPFMMIFLR